LTLTKTLVEAAEKAEEQTESDLVASASTEEQEIGAEMRSLSNEVAAKFSEVQRDRATAERYRLELGAPDVGDFDAMSISILLEDVLDDLEKHRKVRKRNARPVHF
jgi:hypothetical protein